MEKKRLITRGIVVVGLLAGLVLAGSPRTSKQAEAREQELLIDVFAGAMALRSVQLGDSAVLSDCGLAAKLKSDSSTLYTLLPIERIRTRMVPCSSTPLSGTLSVIEVSADSQKNLVRLRYDRPQGGYRREDVWTDRTRPMLERQGITLWLFTSH